MPDRVEGQPSASQPGRVKRPPRLTPRRSQARATRPAAVTRVPGFRRMAHRSDAKQRRSSGQSVITGGDRALLFFWKASEVDLSGLIRVQKWPRRQGVHRRKHEDGRGSRHAVRRKDCPTQGTCREKVTGTDCYHPTTAGILGGCFVGVASRRPMPVKRVVTWISSSQLEGAARVYFGGKD